MKRISLLLFCLFMVSAAWSQDTTTATTGYSGAIKPSGTKVGVLSYSRDFVMLQLTYDNWNGLPVGDNSSGWNRGFNFALMYDFPIQQSHFSFALGLGVSTSGVFFKNKILNIVDSTTSTLTFTQSGEYKKYKIATTYLEVPLELRFREFPDNANKGFKAAIGLKLGILADAHEKGKRAVGGEAEIEKFKSKQFFNPYRAAATARIGWGNFSVFGSYSITPLFKQNTGLTVNQYSFGICLSGM
jgi:Outer membrane protein beta-barrel domain